MPNPWDAGTAKVLAAVGFQALATTSGGFAASLGRLDYSVTREEALEHATVIAGAVDVPVSADLENCFAHDPSGVASTAALAVEAGLAGFSIEDFTGDHSDPIYPLDQAAARVAAVVQAADGLVVTARAENYLRGRRELSDTIARLQAYGAAGAGVLYAPGMTDIDEIRTLVKEVDKPVNVLALPHGPTVPELADAGVARVSVGSGFTLVAFGAIARAGRELLDHGTYGWMDVAGEGRAIAAKAFT
jgi:2-methylisocitrate lyase-like PEP mutase family enzyme